MEGVVQLLLKWIAKLPTPPSVAASSSSTPNTPSTTVRPDVHSLLDIKYSLIILENATYPLFSFLKLIKYNSYSD